jgi:ATP-dependent Zn protease
VLLQDLQVIIICWILVLIDLSVKGADLHQLVNLAAIKAAGKSQSQVTAAIIDDVRDDILMGK